MEAQGEFHELSLRPAAMKLANNQADGKLRHGAGGIHSPAKPDPTAVPL
jgi:hypothetical protein